MLGKIQSIQEETSRTIIFYCSFYSNEQQKVIILVHGGKWPKADESWPVSHGNSWNYSDSAKFCDKLLILYQIPRSEFLANFRGKLASLPINNWMQRVDHSVICAKTAFSCPGQLEPKAASISTCSFPVRTRETTCKSWKEFQNEMVVDTTDPPLTKNLLVTWSVMMIYSVMAHHLERYKVKSSYFLTVLYVHAYIICQWFDIRFIFSLSICIGFELKNPLFHTPSHYDGTRIKKKTWALTSHKVHKYEM